MKVQEAPWFILFYQSLKEPQKYKVQMIYTKPTKIKKIIASNYVAMYGALILWGSALVFLESIGMFLTSKSSF